MSSNPPGLRFVVLHHTGWSGHPDHYDLLLQLNDGRDENDRVLKTFTTREDVFPSSGSTLKLNADHRRAYLNVEGAVSGDRGSVVRVDQGSLHWLRSTDRLFKFMLSGERLNGSFCIREMFHDAYRLEENSES